MTEWRYLVQDIGVSASVDTLQGLLDGSGSQGWELQTRSHFQETLRTYAKLGRYHWGSHSYGLILSNRFAPRRMLPCRAERNGGHT